MLLCADPPSAQRFARPSLWHVKPSVSAHIVQSRRQHRCRAQLEEQRACATASLDVRIRRVQSILDFRWPDYQQVARLLAIAFYSDSEPWIPTVDQKQQQQQQQQPGASYDDAAGPSSGVAPSIDDLDLWSWGRTQEQQQQQKQVGGYDVYDNGNGFRGRLGAELFGWASLLSLLAQHVVYGRRHVTLLAEAGSKGQLVGCAGVTVDLAPEDVATAVSANVAGAEAAEAGAAADGGKGVPGGVPAAAAATGGTLGGALTTAGGGGVAGVALAAVATASAPAAATRAGERLRQGGRDSAKERKAAEGAEAAAGTQTADGGPVLQPGGDYGLLTGLAVHPACRRRGVASALLAAAAELVAERVAAPALLALLVARTNTGAVRLYERAGFQQQAAWEDERWKAEAERGKVGKPRRLLMAKWVA